MTEECAIEARYVNHRNIQGRGVLQIILEIPVEHTTEFFNKFGHPDPGKEKRVGLALLATETNEVSVKDELSKIAEKNLNNTLEEGRKRRFEEMPYSQQAALLCKNRRFAVDYFGTDGENTAIELLRSRIGIKSRAELDDVSNNTARIKFEYIRNDFYSQTRSYPEQRG